jgi:hypothetical protein
MSESVAVWILGWFLHPESRVRRRVVVAHQDWEGTRIGFVASTRKRRARDQRQRPHASSSRCVAPYRNIGPHRASYYELPTVLCPGMRSPSSGHDPCSPSPAYPSYATRFVEPGQQLRLPCCRLIYPRLTGKEIEFRPIIIGDAINEHDACAAN